MSEKANVELIISLAKEGKTVNEIIEETGYASCTVRKWLKVANQDVCSRKTKVTQEVIDNIKSLLDDGKTNSEIAKILNMSPTTVRKYTYQALNSDTNSIKTKRISNKELKLTNEQLEIIYGSMLGDASMDLNWKNARVIFSHGGSQEAYFDYKCSFFTDILGKVNKTDRYDKRTDKYYHKFVVKLLAHPVFTEMRKEFYNSDGIKTVTKEWCNKLTPRGLAFWFMDDGTNSGVIATNSFSLEEVQLLTKTLLDKWGIETTIQHQKNKGGLQNLIYIKTASRPIFYKLVIPYFIPSMEYKLEGWK